ncbi:MAG TPA: hypothetical protein VFW28_17165 [Micropepsaceae bacterium]|nr:hypothetical protein [Micropepsaceae bacterium]
MKWTHGMDLKPADSIHVASALEMKCEELLSSDKRIRRLLSDAAALTKFGINVRNGRETQCLPAKYRQLEMGNGKDGKSGKSGKTH